MSAAPTVTTACAPRSRSALSRHVTPPPSVPSPPRQRIDALDGLRGIAAVTVVVFHMMTRMQPQLAEGDGLAATMVRLAGQNAVIAFFVVSGFLICKPMIASILNHRPYDLHRYALSRVVRIFPLWWLVLGASLVLFRPEAGSDPVHILLLASLQQNYDPELVKAVVSPAWSLVIELSFYVLAPTVLMGIVRGWLRAGASAVPRAARVVMVAATIAAGMLLPWLYRSWKYAQPEHPGPDRDALTWSLVPWLDCFAAGALVALVMLAVTWRGGRGVQVAIAGAAFAIALGTMQWLVPREDALQRSGISIAFALLLLALVLAPRGPVSGVLSSRPLLHLGRLCYGVYLWHMVVIHAVRDATSLLASDSMLVWGTTTLFVVGASIALAELSWRILESPALSWAARCHDRKSARAGMLSA